MRFIIFLLISISLLSAANLEVTIQGIKDNKGVVQITLFNQSQGFPHSYKKGITYKTLEISGSTIITTFTNLSYGTYAVAIIHDENRNRKIDAGVFGIPKEGYGVSNNITPKTRAPRFNEASLFLADDADTTISIKVKYP